MLVRLILVFRTNPLQTTQTVQAGAWTVWQVVTIQSPTPVNHSLSTGSTTVVEQ